MSEIIEEFREKIKMYHKLRILISDHAVSRIIKRKLDANLIIRSIKLGENLINVKKQSYNKYKVILQNDDELNYCIILVLLETRIDVITGWEI